MFEHVEVDASELGKHDVACVPSFYLQAEIQVVLVGLHCGILGCELFEGVVLVLSQIRQDGHEFEGGVTRQPVTIACPCHGDQSVQVVLIFKLESETGYRIMQLLTTGNSHVILEVKLLEDAMGYPHVVCLFGVLGSKSEHQSNRLVFLLFLDNENLLSLVYCKLNTCLTWDSVGYLVGQFGWVIVQLKELETPQEVLVLNPNPILNSF